MHQLLPYMYYVAQHKKINCSACTYIVYATNKLQFYPSVCYQYFTSWRIVLPLRFTQFFLYIYLYVSSYYIEIYFSKCHHHNHFYHHNIHILSSLMFVDNNNSIQFIQHEICYQTRRQIIPLLYTRHTITWCLLYRLRTIQKSRRMSFV